MSIREYLTVKLHINWDECKVLEESKSEMSLMRKDQSVVAKIFDISKLTVSVVKSIKQSYCLLSDISLPYVIPSQIYADQTSHFMIFQRDLYDRDLEKMIQSKSLSSGNMCDVICSICDILRISCDYDVMVGNLKSSNVVYDKNNNVKLCDLFLNLLRKEEDLRVYDICFKSPDELNGLECNERSVIWSIGCILYEMILKKLPFNEDDNMMKTMNNIMRCEYSLDGIEKCDGMMKEMIKRMLKVKSEDRLSLKELSKEMIKVSEMLKDSNGCLMMCEDRKEMLYEYDKLIITLPIEYLHEYYLNSKEWEKIRDAFIESYNNNPSDRILSILLMMKIHKEDSNHGMLYYSCYKTNKDKLIKDLLQYRINHKNKRDKECYLDKMIFNINTGMRDREIVKISSECICFCTKGINYLFKILSFINTTKLQFGIFIYLFLIFHNHYSYQTAIIIWILFFTIDKLTRIRIIRLKS